ncbi:ferredoxin [Clostridium sp. YIM B02506]|nr:ferredoxin [Clostridium sp. YIM B02506]
MKAFFDKNRCIFCGMCGGICSDVFRADFDNKAVALDLNL